MVVLCDIKQCGYNYNGMCANRAININRDGMCSELISKKAGSHIDNELKEIPNVLTIVKHQD